MTTHTGCACSHGNPTEILKAEHRVIERVLDALERLAAQDRIDAALFRGAIDFLRNFADGCHHAKEENELFPRLKAAGIPQEGGPIGCMLDEHARGRALIGAMLENLEAAADGAPSALRALRMAAAQYVDLLRRHIWKEDNVLFELADQVLSNHDHCSLLGGFDRTEASETNAGRHEHYVNLANELYRRALELPAATPKGSAS